MYDSINPHLHGQLTLNIVFDLISLGLKILENGGLFNNIIGELIPLHISIAININLIKQVGQIPN